MLYFIKITIYAALMYGFYLLVLKDKARHSVSRAYLLCCAVLPVFLPLIELPERIPLQQSGALGSMLLPALTVTGSQYSTIFMGSDIYVLLLVTYLIIAIAMFIRFVHGHIIIRSFLARHADDSAYGVSIYKNTGIGPGSWKDNVFFPGSEIEPAILQHELAHVRLRHSYDILLLGLLRCLLWPNVVLLLIEHELKMIHEYQADACAAEGLSNYPLLLLDNVLDTNRFTMSHTFFHHPIKRRIAMLQTNKPRARYAGGIAAVFIFIMVVSVILLQSFTPTATAQVAVAQQEVIYQSAQVMPSPTVDLPTFLKANLKYPPEAKAKKIQGQVLVGFVVDKDGSLKDFKVMRSPDPLLTRSALIALGKMPKWNPGIQDNKYVATRFYLPVVFALN